MKIASLPTPLELTSLLAITITADQHWNPNSHHSEPYAIPYPLHTEDSIAHVHHISRPYDPSETTISTYGIPMSLPTWDFLTALAAPTCTTAMMTTKAINPSLAHLQPYLGYQSFEVIKQTLLHTTHLAKAHLHFPLHCHVKARFIQHNRP